MANIFNELYTTWLKSSILDVEKDCEEYLDIIVGIVPGVVVKVLYEKEFTEGYARKRVPGTSIKIPFWPSMHFENPLDELTEVQKEFLEDFDTVRGQVKSYSVVVCSFENPNDKNDPEIHSFERAAAEVFEIEEDDEEDNFGVWWHSSGSSFKIDDNHKDAPLEILSYYAEAIASSDKDISKWVVQHPPKKPYLDWYREFAHKLILSGWNLYFGDVVYTGEPTVSSLQSSASKVKTSLFPDKDSDASITINFMSQNKQTSARLGDVFRFDQLVKDIPSHEHLSKAYKVVDTLCRKNAEYFQKIALKKKTVS